MDEALLYFSALPKELKNIIFSFLDLDVAGVLRLQSVSSEFQKLCWSTLREYDIPLFASKHEALISSIFFARANRGHVQKMNCENGFYSRENIVKIIKQFPNLEQINFRQSIYHAKQDIIAQAEQHPKLQQISFDLNVGFEYNYRKNGAIPQDLVAQPRKFKTYLFTSNTQPFYQQKPIAFHRAYHRGGTIGENMIVIGATDGTLTFLTLDAVNSNLKIQSTDYNCHKACINAIWTGVDLINNLTQARARPNTYIASSDGIVSSWSCVNDEPVLNQTIVFPESILFVCDHADKYVLAAGKRTLYIAEIETNKIIREVATDDDITGVISVDKTVTFTTRTSHYTLKEDFASDDDYVLQKISEISCPNVCISPEASLMIIVCPKKVKLLERKTSTEIHLDSYTSDQTRDTCNEFDTRPHLSSFSPRTFCMTVSVGSRLTTYDLESRMQISQVAPHILPLETDPEHPPTCNAFWYAPNGYYLFSLFSNNVLYWWHIST